MLLFLFSFSPVGFFPDGRQGCQMGCLVPVHIHRLEGYGTDSLRFIHTVLGRGRLLARRGPFLGRSARSQDAWSSMLPFTRQLFSSYMPSLLFIVGRGGGDPSARLISLSPGLRFAANRLTPAGSLLHLVSTRFI